MNDNERRVEQTVAICWTIGMCFLIASFAACGMANAEEPLRVLMIDAGTPYTALKVKVNKGRNYSIKEVKRGVHYHADAMYQFINEGTPCVNVVVDWCIFFANGGINERAYQHCLSRINDYDIVNMSLAGEVLEEYEFSAIYNSRRPIVVVAAGNEGKARHISYPAWYTNLKPSVLAISALELTGARLPSSNWDTKTIDYVGVGCYKDRKGRAKCTQGTSVAAALYTNKLIKELCPSKSKIGDKIK